MLNSTLEQFRLAEDGQISWQENASNPLPGAPIGVLAKGEHPLKPAFTLSDEAAVLKGLDPAAVQAKVQEWLESHIKTVLEDLVALRDSDDLCESGKGIAAKLYDALGILPREEVEDLIAGLDTETRRPVRRKKIKLGPILIFIYSLNKPAAVRLRALLWSLYHDRPLPAAVPNDGIVSMKVDPSAIDAEYYRAIGYPVYATRAIRVDMLDRLISAVYDGADKGKFSAKHEMAEWLGCSIPDLYLVLEAMGHAKVFDPATEAASAPADVSAEPAVEPAEAEAVSEVAAPDVALEDVVPTDTAPKVVVADVKPELAVFRLKKGKANQKKAVSGGGSKSDKKPFNKDKKKAAPKKGKPKRDEGPRVITSNAPAPKPEDSPFAILGQLKK